MSLLIKVIILNANVEHLRSAFVFIEVFKEPLVLVEDEQPI